MGEISTIQVQQRLSAGDLYWFVCQRCGQLRVESIPRNLATTETWEKSKTEIVGFVAWITTDDVANYPPTAEEICKLRNKYKDLSWPIQQDA